MPKITITTAVKQGRILVSDGSWGAYLHTLGLKPGECPELWCAEHFGEVAGIARSYRAAGADMVKTNSFGGSRFKLAYYGLDKRAAELNEAAAKASREGAGPDAWVLGSIGPTGKLLITEEVTEDELYEAFAEQAAALECGGADAILVETMSDETEAVLAVKAAKEHTKCEVICTFTFEKTVRGEYRTMMGLAPEDAVRASGAAGADIIGTNCGNGIARMVEIVAAIRCAMPDAPLLVHSNAGMPQVVNGENVFPETPEYMAGFVPDLIKAGANIIGGCCGTMPGHIRAIKKAVLGYTNA